MKPIPQLIKKFPAFYGTRQFITTFTSARHLSLSWATSIQSISLYLLLNMHFSIILPYMPTSSKWSLPSRFSHQNPACTSPLSHTFNMPHPSNSLWFVTGIIFDEGYRCCLLYHIDCVGRLYPRCLDPYFDPDFGDTKFVRSVGRPEYQPKYKALHFRRQARDNSTLCISFF